MASVAVVSDTTAYLPPDMVEQHEVTLVSLYVNFGPERAQPEIEISDYEAFFEELRSGERLPTTSQPSVGDFVAAYEPLLAAGKDVVSLHISGGISGTVEAARQEADALERDGKGGERVHVYDSETSAGGLGMLVLVAARAAERGCSAQEVLDALTEARKELKIWFVLDTLEFLKLGGRIGGVSAWIGSTLKVKPILTLEKEMAPIERVRTSKRAFERMVHFAEQLHEDGADAWVVQHIHSPEEGERLTARGREVFGCEPIFVSEVGAVLATHTGPGMLGIGGIPRRHLG